MNNDNIINIIKIGVSTETSIVYPLNQDYINSQLIRKLSNELVDSKVAPIEVVSRETYGEIYSGLVLEHDLHINLISDEDKEKIKKMEKILKEHDLIKLLK